MVTTMDDSELSMDDGPQEQDQDQVDLLAPKRSMGISDLVNFGMTNINTSSGGTAPATPSSTTSSSDSLRLKSRVGPFLVVVFLVLCFSVAFLSLDWDDQHFHEAFAQDAHKLLAHIRQQGSNNLEAMAALGSLASVTASATQLIGPAMDPSTPTSWPFLTIPHFESQAAHSLAIMKTSQVFISPLVDNQQERLEWETYSSEHAQYWSDTRIAPVIFKIQANGTKVPEDGPGPFQPVWQIAPSANAAHDANFNLASMPSISSALQAVYKTQKAVLTGPLPGSDDEQNMMNHLDIFSVQGQQDGEPISLMILPIFDDDSDNDEQDHTVVAVLVAPFLFQSFLLNALGVHVPGRVMVVLHSCNQTHSYHLHQNNTVQYIGQGDQHHPFYSDLKQSNSFPTGVAQSSDGIAFTQDYACGQYQLDVYPTAVYQNHTSTNGPVISTVFIVVLCVCLFLSFLLVGGRIHDQMEQVTKKAQEASNLVDTLFPKDIQDRLFQVVNHSDSRQSSLQNNNNAQNKKKKKTKKTCNIDLDDDPLSKLKELLGDSDGMDPAFGADVPIADLFVNCTVLFADIQGFTAWSGCREPVQVFTLLECLFSAFDECAKRRHVFKVETIGDSYVAVCGLPTPNKDHAICAVKFAADCIQMMSSKTRELEPNLGPDTGDLKIRIGLNSGPVTAGVLRGERGRFQLFGDTVNTAARMESNGVANRIHVSQETADCLTQAGKDHWLTQRKDRVTAKGKGEMITYFVDPSNRQQGVSATNCSNESSSSSLKEDEHVETKRLDTPDDKTQRLIDWNTEVFARLLREIVAHREANQSVRSSTSRTSLTTATSGFRSSFNKEERHTNGGGTLLDEVMDILEVSSPVPSSEPAPIDRINRPLDPVVMDQLREFIRRISDLYHFKNPFHNFDHASHVTMNCTKVLSRIVTNDKSHHGDDSVEDLTYGLTNNPLTRFAICFGALIHDADHPGVTNNQLILEGSPLAVKYKNRSVAEQHSLELSLDLLLEEEFADLYSEICATEKDRRHFRALVVNTVMATDIMDKELKEQRNSRWERAFQGEGDACGDEIERQNARSTVVIEHLIQASDVSHTMQHWHVFRKWNQCLFEEMYKAYKEGRAQNDPSVFWYEGELGFFDYYIIPLAKKLSDCGVFGVSSDEFLNYALANRKEWQQKGRDVVKEMMRNIQDAEDCRVKEVEV
ncbi:Receptor-type guanylate cyclase gcy [Seminavis robusta]|uniref:Receptor-type guanylate cyclase gcy n=1 Tax=Seminavis robusta TaxID=568900 RepID=A0A9N8DLP7_9STRA|nr:Receptor-type guanylate cyclase gcy [Seminavis robusta]|eukprot:Sro212_g088090.1 Receptor-type guanylate cyclase gcy (1191) ;mRNA; f:9163-13895